MVRRSRLELCFDVLAVVDQGVYKPTRIMYKTNLSWTTLHEVFDTLVNGGFIQEETYNNKKRYSITDKGRRALMYHRQSIHGLARKTSVLQPID
jgi:predicted transcriptional regulator